jgi:transposase
MAYIVEQKVGNHVYLYEVESYWDPAKKQPRQRRKYLGRKDPVTGQPVAAKRGGYPRSCREVGHVHLLEHLAAESGLTAVLAEVFGEEAGLLLDLAMYQVAEGRPLYLFRSWQEGVREEADSRASSPRLSERLRVWGRDAGAREEFFRRWIARTGEVRGVVLDVTSLSSHARLVDLLEWGYNRDGEALPQVNLGVVLGQPANVPIAYRLWPGSIPDVSTLALTVTVLREYGLAELAFVLDRGYYSAANLARLHAEPARFVLPLPLTTRLAGQLLVQHRKALRSPGRAFCFQHRSQYHQAVAATVGEVPVTAHLFFDPRRQAEEEALLIRRLDELERLAAGRRFRSRRAAALALNAVWRGARRLFTLSLEDGVVTLRRKEKAIRRLMNRMGFLIHLTNDPALDREAVLQLYARRDRVEKLFDVLKNELREDRLRVSSREALEGRIFLAFLALILHTLLDNAMRRTELYQSLTIAEVLAELRKLRRVDMSSGRAYLMEITKKQRTIYETLNVPIPQVI